MRSDTKPTALLTFTGLFAAMITIMKPDQTDCYRVLNRIRLQP